jgi:hypothetical protein
MYGMPGTPPRADVGCFRHFRFLHRGWRSGGGMNRRCDARRQSERQDGGADPSRHERIPSIIPAHTKTGPLKAGLFDLTRLGSAYQ